MNDLDVKKIRERLAVSQEQLAEMIGVHTRTIQNWESGTPIPKSKHAILRNLQPIQQQYYGGNNESDVHGGYRNPADAMPNTDRWFDLLEAKEKSLAKSQEQIDKLLSIISQLTIK